MNTLFREMERVSQRFTTAIRGITVVKTVWANDEGLSVVRFEISSDRDDHVRLRLVESVPDDFPMENIGPHPKYGGGKWTKTGDHELVYTDRLEPNEEAFTLYGIKELSETTLESFLTDAVVDIDPASDEPQTDSDDVPIMTTEDTEDGEPDDDTEQNDDFTRGGDDTDDFTRGGSSTDDFTRGGGGNFDDHIPRVEDLGSVSGGWGSDQPHQNRDSSDIQFVGSKAHSSGSADTDDARQPIELEDPVQNDDTSETREEDDGESDAVDSPDSAEEPDAPTSDTGDTAVDGEDDHAPGDSDTTADHAPSDSEDEDDVSEEAVSSDDGTLFDDEREPSNDESIVDALVAELSARDLSDDEREVLRDALGPSERTSVDVRLRHVQNRVDDLSAYIEALESFLDENGTAEQVLDELQTETAAMRSDIEDLESAVSASQDALELVERQVQTLEDSMVNEARFDERLGEFETHLDELDERLVSESEFEGELDDLTDELATLRDEVETGKQWRSNLSQAIQLPGMMESDGGETDADE